MLRGEDIQKVLEGQHMIVPSEKPVDDRPGVVVVVPVRYRKIGAVRAITVYLRRSGTGAGAGDALRAP